jgi:hypothetical protein
MWSTWNVEVCKWISVLKSVFNSCLRSDTPRFRFYVKFILTRGRFLCDTFAIILSRWKSPSALLCIVRFRKAVSLSEPTF